MGLPVPLNSHWLHKPSFGLAKCFYPKTVIRDHGWPQAWSALGLRDRELRKRRDCLNFHIPSTQSVWLAQGWSLTQVSSGFSSVTQSGTTLCDPMDCSMPSLSVHHQLLEFTQTHIHRVGDAIQPSHPLSFPSPPAFNLAQHQGLFQWVSSSHQVTKVLEFQLQH